TSCAVNVAVTVVFAFSVTIQVPVPEQPPPDQPENTEPPAGTAVSVIAVADWNIAVHVAPQLIPAGFDVTVPPAPPPSSDGVTVIVKLTRVNVTVTLRAVLI